jgi:hypothetical protein
MNPNDVNLEEIAASTIEDKVSVDLYKIELRRIDIEQHIPLGWDSHIIANPWKLLVRPLGAI